MSEATPRIRKSDIWNQYKIKGLPSVDELIDYRNKISGQRDQQHPKYWEWYDDEIGAVDYLLEIHSNSM